MIKRYTCVLQQDNTDCGAACLATVSLSHRQRVSVAAIRQYAGTDHRGTNVLGMVEAAERLGFHSKAVRTSMDGLINFPLPAVAHVTQSNLFHYVVIHRITANRIIIADPARGILKCSLKEFEAIWTGVLILAVPGPSFRANNKSVTTWQRFFRLLEPHDFLLAETFVATLVLMVLGFGTSLYIQSLVDQVLLTRDWAMLKWLSVGLLFVLLCRAVIGALRSTVLAYVGRRLDVSLMLEYYRHVVRLPMQFFESRHTGEIISRLGDAVKVRELVSGTTLSLLVDASTMVAAFALLFFYSSKLALISISLLPVLGMIVVLVNRPLKKAQRKTMETAALLHSHLVESLTGIPTLKAACAEDSATAKAEQKITGLLRSLFSATVWGTSSATAGELISGAALVLVLWTAGSLVLNNEMSVGQLIASYSILLYTLQPMLRLMNLNQQVQDAVIAADRIAEILDLPSEFEDESPAVELAANTPGEIVLEDVSFSYGTRSAVLHNINLHVPSCSSLAIVGKSGSGKTTLAKLLLRLHEPTSGRIEIDGFDLRDIGRESLRRAIACVDQDLYLFKGSIEENLTLGCPDISAESLFNSVRAAGLESFINSLSNRYKTDVGERGALLSAGQRQRLAIARALIREPRVLILDEATSYLDSQSELAIQDVIAEMKQQSTIIIIAHRLSSIKSADQIAVLDGGKLVECGSHVELMKDRGHYYELWRAQTSHLNNGSEVVHSSFEQVTA